MAIKSKLPSLEPARKRLRTSIKLLSGAYYARDAFPDGMITVYPWDYDIDLWVQGQRQGQVKPDTLYRVLPMVCDLNGVDVNVVPIGDLFTILTVARAITLDSVIKYSPVCPSCAVTNQEIEVKIPSGLARFGEKGPDYPGWDEFTLPKSGDSVRVRPLTIGDERAIVARSPEAVAKVDHPKMRILTGVVSIGGGVPESLDELLGWWAALHPADKVEFTRKQDDLFPHLGDTIEHSCDACGFNFVVPLGIDATFFRARL